VNPALQVALACAGIYSAAGVTILLYLVSDLKGDIREIRGALGIGPAAKEAAHVR
jgi:hypothetical protein